MAFLFKRNPKTPSELVRAITEQVVKFDNPSLDRRKLQDEMGRYLTQVKVILHGDENSDPQPDLIANLAQEVYASEVLYLLIQNMQALEFDSRKDVASLVSTLLRRKIGDRSPTVDYLAYQNPKILTLLLKGPEIPETCLITGGILRECIKVEILAKIVLQDPLVWKYFDFSCRGTFENMTDSFQTLSELLTTHQKLAADWLGEHSPDFIIHINKLMTTENNYVTRIQSIKLLAQLLATISNLPLRLAYINDSENLKLVMTLLSDKSKNIPHEAFNIFKVFIANPKRPKPVQDILIKNRDKLLHFLEKYNPAGKEDTNFKDEKEFVYQRITDLPRIIPSPSTNI